MPAPERGAGSIPIFLSRHNPMQFIRPIILKTIGSKLAIFGGEDRVPAFALEYDTLVRDSQGDTIVIPHRAFHSIGQNEPMVPVPMDDDVVIHVPLSEVLAYVTPTLAAFAEHGLGQFITVFDTKNVFGGEPRLQLLPFMFNEHRDVFFSQLDDRTYGALPDMIEKLNVALAAFDSN